MLQDIDLSYSGGLLKSGHAFSAAGLIANGVDVNGVEAADHGLIAWTFDPIFTASTTTSAANLIYLAGIYLRRPRTISKLWFIVNVVGVTPTAGANNVGLYNSSGTLLSSVNVDAKISVSGPNSATLASPVTAPAGLCWVAMQFQATTQPGIARANAFTLGAITANQGASTLRFATNGSGATLPASITPASNTTSLSAALWAGVS